MDSVYPGYSVHTDFRPLRSNRYVSCPFHLTSLLVPFSRPAAYAYPVAGLTPGVAVPVLCAWHVYMVARGETSIESHDNAYFETKAKAEGLKYINPYDLGYKRNLQEFFNLGPKG